MMTAPALDAFEVNASGMARCPAHEDKVRSLSIKPGSDGRALFRCHAGCTVEEIVTAAGLTMSDLFAPQLEVVSSGEPVAVYDYHAADGSLAYIVKRWPDKRFSMHKPDGSSIGDTERVPYHLPDLLAVKPGKGITIVEGEKDADRLRSLGLAATCNPGGSNAWPATWGHYFADKTVRVIADADAAGATWAANVIASVRDVARDVALVALPDLPAKKGADVSDWLDAGHGVDELRLLLLQAPVANDGAVEMADFLALQLDPPRWLVDGLVPVGPSVGALVGSFKNGKSLAGLQLCIVTARGSSDFLGHEVIDGGPCVFIEYEGSKSRLQERVRTMAAKYGVLAEPIPLAIVHRPDHKVDTDEGEAWLRRLCRGRVLCVIGPVSKAASIQRENEPSEWQAVAERLQRVSDATGCSVVLIHHTRKPSIDGAPRQVNDYFLSARGSNSYMGAVDFALGVQRDPDDSEGVLYSLQRDGASEREPYTFDASSLCIWPDSRPLRQANRTERIESLYAYIEEHPDCTRKAIMADLGYTLDNLKDHLTLLGQRIAEDGEGRHPRTYRVVA